MQVTSGSSADTGCRYKYDDQPRNEAECCSQFHTPHGWPSKVFTFVVSAVDTFQRPLSLMTVSAWT